MKKQLLFLICTFMCLSGHAVVTDVETLDNTLYIDTQSANPGSRINIGVKIKNTVTISNFAFDVYLPDGMSFVCDQSEAPVGLLNDERIPTGMFDLTSSTLQGNGAKFQTSVNSNHLDDNPSFYGTDGVVMTFAVAVSESMVPGSYTITLKNMEVTNYETQQRASDLRKVELETPISVESNYVFLDEDSTGSIIASDGIVDVRVKRTINANSWSTICLPFAMTAEQVKEAFGEDVELADFTGVETEEDDAENTIGITVKFQTATEIEANHPYIIKVSEAVDMFTVDGVIIDPAEDLQVDCDEYTYTYKIGKKTYTETVYNSFIGTYVSQTQVPDKALFISDNKFYYSTGSTVIKGFRGYFDFYVWLSEVDGDSEVKMVFNVDGTTTSINEMEEGQPSNDKWYDISGRRVVKPAQRGLYIVNSKKVMKK